MLRGFLLAGDLTVIVVLHMSKKDLVMISLSFTFCRPYRKYKQKTYKRKSYDKPCIKEI